ncbi:MAG TPA: biotin--[acetyl-CoA-carboxylase] ligase [Vicinamibacterales bacterium]|nr:biotin--[acetyl-CoA-carboxylase] ligase [Vicinamibacterales bacterium]
MLPASSPAPAAVLAAFQAATARAASVRLELRWYPTVTSTMDVAEEAAQAGAPEGLVIVAEEQTQGRGRRGRVWSSPPGAGLYLTFVLRPPLEGGAGPMLSLITLAVGVAAREAIGRASGLLPELKWPNDLMVGKRKLAGILSEGIGLGRVDQTVLVGCGLNILSVAHPDEIAGLATSLESELGRSVDRAHVLEELLVAIPQTCDDLRRGNADDILRAWRHAAPSAEGAFVRWPTPEGPRQGTTAGIDQTGALLVKTGGGTERIVGGELEWIW